MEKHAQTLRFRRRQLPERGMQIRCVRLIEYPLLQIDVVIRIRLDRDDSFP
jgi:hypothetical protein